MLRSWEFWKSWSWKFYIWLCNLVSGFPRSVKSIEFQNWFSRPWKSIDFCQNVH